MSEAGMRMDFAGEDRERLAAMRKRQILIVEDEFVNREILKAYLEPEYEVLCAETGEEAREIMNCLRKNEKAPGESTRGHWNRPVE